MERTTILTEWIREHEGAHFEYHCEESETSTLPSKEAEKEQEQEQEQEQEEQEQQEQQEQEQQEEEQEKEEKEEKEEEEEGEEKMMMTPNVKPLLEQIDEENEQGIPMEKEVMVQTLETATLEGHTQKMLICASKMKGEMNDSAEHGEEQENVDEIGDHIGCSSMSEKKKRKQMSPTLAQDIVKENPSSAHVENPERDTVIPGVDSTRTSTMSAMKDSIRSGRITKKRRSQRKTTGTRASIEATNVPVLATNTLSPTTSTDLNEVWQLILCTMKLSKNNII